MDWSALFTTTMSLPELVVRGSVTFLVLYTLMRIVGRRESASINMTDVLVVVLVADAASTGMTGAGETPADGFVLVVVILFWSVLLDALSYRFPWFRKLVKASPAPLIRDGEMVHRTLKREFMTKDEVMTQLRLHGIEDVTQVTRAYLEPNGAISILSEADDEDAERTVPSRDAVDDGDDR